MATIDEKKSIVENAIDISNIEILKNFHSILIDEKNESFLAYLISVSWQKLRPKSFEFLLDLCKEPTVIDLNLSHVEKKSTDSKNYLVCGKTFVDGLCDGKFRMKMSTENMNGLAKFVMFHYPRRIASLMSKVRLIFTVSDYEDIIHLGTMQQGKIPVIFEKSFWHRFCKTFDFIVDFNLYPISKNLTHIFTTQPKFKQIGILLNQLYYVMRKPVKPWTGDPLARTEQFSQYQITHKDIYTILPAIANCILLLKNAILYDLYIYIIAGLVSHKGMILGYIPLIKIQNLCSVNAGPLIKQWLKNLKVWHSTLDSELCNKYRIIPMLQENSWRNKVEDPWDRSCFTLEEFKEYYSICKTFGIPLETSYFIAEQYDHNGETIKIYYPEEYVFVCHVLDFLISATSLRFDKLINSCIDECLGLVPCLNLREILHNTIEPEYVDKFAKLVDGVTNPMLRRAFLESKKKYRVLVTKPILYHGVPANVLKANTSFDYSQYYEEWLAFCRTHKLSLDIDKLKEFIGTLRNL